EAVDLLATALTMVLGPVLRGLRLLGTRVVVENFSSLVAKIRDMRSGGDHVDVEGG
ncbi:hypothetical protein HK097_004573, partial [Rhizophlyctis rosea]